MSESGHDATTITIDVPNGADREIAVVGLRSGGVPESDINRATILSARNGRYLGSIALVVDDGMGAMHAGAPMVLIANTGADPNVQQLLYVRAQNLASFVGRAIVYAA